MRFHCRSMVGIVLISVAIAASAEDGGSVVLAPAPTESSQIWLDPALPGGADAAKLAARGYERHEFFQSGTANVYGYEADGKVKIESTGVPYTTRVVVVRPSDQQKFSGNVQLNPFHPLFGMGSWNLMDDLILDKGDAYVGVLIGADANTRGRTGEPPMAAHKVLTWFNPTRYARINWPEEDGIRWDVFAATARWIRAPDALLGSLKPTHIYASGWSFDGSFLRTYINSGFHDMHRRADGKPLIDGYLIAISSKSFRSGFLPLNAQTPILPDDDPRRNLLPIDSPIIELLSEAEALTQRDPQAADIDTGLGAHRLYEVAGVTHSTGGTSTTMARQIEMRLGKPMPSVNPLSDAKCPFPNTDIQLRDYAHAVLDNLDQWVRRGVPPPRAARYESAGARGKKDTNGNTLGGVTPPQIEVPLAFYGDAPGCDVAGASVASLLPMRRVPLEATRLSALYAGGKKEYLRRINAAIDKRVAQRWLRQREGDRQKVEAITAAQITFSTDLGPH